MGVMLKMISIQSYIVAGLDAFGALKESLARLFIKVFTTKKSVKYMNKYSKLLISVLMRCFLRIYKEVMTVIFL